ncbi:hypothetical protein [Aromatoleum sp.]|uniref:hypothetical protein n=1 Tax=Aromatoleum sp. TaxID=2307007 RepID=UPI002FC937C8
MGLLDWLRGGAAPPSGPDRARIAEAVERIVQTANPRLRYAPRYARRLTPAVASALTYAAELVATVPAAREATAAGWAADPCMRSLFATPDDVVRAFSRSIELRAFFDEHPLADEVYAVIGTRMEERRVLGTALEGSVIRHDVEQTTVGFTDHRVRILGLTEAELRTEVERRIVDQLVMDGVGRVAAEQRQREAFEQERALLKTRLSLLEQAGQGMNAALAGERTADAEKLAQVRARLEENSRTLAGMTTGAERLDEELERIIEALCDAGQRFYVTTVRRRLDRMNVVADDDDPASGEEIVFQSALIPADPPETRVFVLARFPKAAMLPAAMLFAEAARQLL